MAIMYPKNIELYNATSSEKKVFKELQKQLPDSYTVFYSIQWVDENNGIKKESECDFLIFSEQDGFLTCEVKGGKGLKKENGKFVLEEADGERELKRSPMEQSEESSRYFFKLYGSEYNDSFNGIYGSICIFPFYSIDDPVLLDHRPKDIVLDNNDMENLEKRIKKAFLFYKSNRFYGSLTKIQRTNFKNMINKKIAARASAGSIIEAKEYELGIVNRVQDNLVYFINNYKRTFISGGAGTGKTWIAYKFAKKASLEGKNVLFTMYSPHLAKMLKGLLESYSNVDVLSFNELIEKDGLEIDISTDKLLDKYDSINFKKYKSIIVDEAQDFDQNQALIISMHLEDNESEMRVFYDMTQNIFDKDFKNGFDIDVPPFTLRENLRNTSSIYEWATSETNLGKEVITNQIIGPSPVSFVFTKKYDLKKYLEGEITNLVDNEKVSLKEIVVLTDHDNYLELKDSPIGRWTCGQEASEDIIKLSLVEDYKGLESSIIFYVHESDTPEKYNYVAFTRAKYYLYDLSLKN